MGRFEENSSAEGVRFAAPRSLFVGAEQLVQGSAPFHYATAPIPEEAVVCVVTLARWARSKPGATPQTVATAVDGLVGAVVAGGLTGAAEVADWKARIQALGPANLVTWESACWALGKP
jgi:hypothetical protein